MKKNNVQMGERTPLVKKLLLVEGISRAGKFLMADLLAGFANVEAVQYYGLLEHIPFLEKFGLIERKTAREILKCEIDTHAYEMAIGRNFNHRQSDKSSIHKNPRVTQFLKRPEENDIPTLMAAYRKENPYSFFVMHELIPHAKLFFETFPQLKMVSLQRSPVELVDSWYRRGLTKRLADDPTLFVLPFKKGTTQYPWYVVGYEKEYAALPEMDRTIFAIERIMALYEQGLKKLTKKERGQILFIRYEDILLKTPVVLKKLSVFLGKKPLPALSAVLKRERLPSLEYVGKREEKLRTIASLASPAFVKRLQKLEAKYLANT